ncbi:MAG: VWA domain-containing protein [Vicinamibacterales bacterium]
MWRVLGLAVLLTAWSSPVAAADDLPLLDVVVDAAGGREPLAAADFTVTDADGPLSVQSAELHTLAGSSDSAPLPGPIESPDTELDAAGRASRLFAIFVDEFHLAESEQLSTIRATLGRFVRDRLGPRDLLVVVKPLESLTSIRMSTDREAAASAIESARGRAGDYTARTPFEQQFLAGAPERIDDARARISQSTLSALVAHVGHLPGARKTLLVISDGFAPPAATRRGMTPGLPSVVRSATSGRVAVYNLLVTAPDVAHRTVSPAEPSGVDDSSSRVPQDLQALAAATTGFTIVGSSGMSDDLDRILRDASRFYVLTVQPRATASGEAFRAVTVKLDRPGAVIRARAGFRLEPRPTVETRARRPQPLNVPRRVSPMIRPWFGLSSAGNDRTRVSFVWEPAAQVPGSGGRRTQVESVSMRVTTLSGEPVFSGRVGPAGVALASSGEVPRLSFDADVGRLLVQMDILDGAGRVVDRDARDLVVGRFREPIAFGTPAVLRARTARELRPLLAGEDAVPTVSREFSRADHLILRIPLVGDAAEVRASLASALGGTMRDLPVTRLSSDPGVAQVDLPLAGLASGGYVVRLEAVTGGARASDRVAFTVRP